MNEKDEIPGQMMEIEDTEMKVKAVTFSGGGEPFLYKPLFKVVRRLTDSSVQFAALSNGSRLRRAVEAQIMLHGCEFLWMVGTMRVIRSTMDQGVSQRWNA